MQFKWGAHVCVQSSRQLARGHACKRGWWWLCAYTVALSGMHRKRVRDGHVNEVVRTARMQAFTRVHTSLCAQAAQAVACATGGTRAGGCIASGRGMGMHARVVRAACKRACACVSLCVQAAQAVACASVGGGCTASGRGMGMHARVVRAACMQACMCICVCLCVRRQRRWSHVHGGHARGWGLHAHRRGMGMHAHTCMCVSLCTGCTGGCLCDGGHARVRTPVVAACVHACKHACESGVAHAVLPRHAWCPTTTQGGAWPVAGARRCCCGGQPLPTAACAPLRTPRALPPHSPPFPPPGPTPPHPPWRPRHRCASWR